MILFNIYLALMLLAGGILLLLFFFFKARTHFKKWQEKEKDAIPPGIKAPPLSTTGSLPETDRTKTSLEDNGPLQQLYQLVIQPSQNRFPFIYKKVKPMELTSFHIKELVSEPPAYVDGSNANIWIYHSPQGKVHLLLAGHANSPVCREISALLYSNYLAMANVGEALLVPGAFYLQSEVDPKLQLLGLGGSSILQLAGDLQPFQKDTGLSVIREFEFDYLKVREEIYKEIRRAHTQGDNVLLELYRNSDEPHALFLPFYQLSAAPTAVSFDLPLALFDSPDFQDLQKIHHQALILEMLDDALRRKQIYQEWLRDDNRRWKELEYEYPGIPMEAKKAKNVQISGTRDYINAKVTKASKDGKEVYISLQEYYEEVLPGLISEDKAWIARMDELMGEINNRDAQRDRRLNEINIAVLIDAFLRGWPPVFLGGSQENQDQKLYLNWCRERREGVWRMIHKQLERQGMHLGPLLEENTVFQIKFIRGRVLRFTPLYLTTDQDCLVYLSSHYGMTYYVNQWNRRKLISKEMPDQQKNLEVAREYYRQGAQWLDQSCEQNPAKEANNLEKGVEAFKLALEAQPAVVQEIWNGWWARYSRNTSAEFEKFKHLVKALKAHTECDFPTARHHLEQFIHQHPDYLPDPYILLAIQETEIAQLMTQQKNKIDDYNELLNRRKAKVEYLKSNQDLVQKIQRLSKKSDPFGYGGYGRGADGGSLSYNDIKRLTDFERIGREVKGLDSQLDALNPELEKLNREIKRAWESIKKNPGQHIRKAKELAPAYVENILTQEKFELSRLYILRFKEIHDILKGDEYVDIAYKMYQDAADLGLKKFTASQLKEKIQGYFNVEYLSREDLGTLRDFRQRLDAIVSADSDVTPIVRELILKKEMERIGSIYFHEGLNAFEQTYLLPEFNEPVLRLTQVYSHHHWQYRRALRYMFNKDVAVVNFAPQGRFIRLCPQDVDQKFNFKQFRFHRERSLIIGGLKTGKEIELVKVENLSAEETQHLEQELENPGFGARGTLGMSLSEKVLNIAIAPSPVSKRWTRALKELEPWLIRLCAYLYIPPVPKPLPEKGKLIEDLEGQPIIAAVDLDPERIRDQFSREIGVKNLRLKHVQID